MASKSGNSANVGGFVVHGMTQQQADAVTSKDMPSIKTGSLGRVYGASGKEKSIAALPSSGDNQITRSQTMADYVNGVYDGSITEKTETTSNFLKEAEGYYNASLSGGDTDSASYWMNMVNSLQDAKNSANNSRYDNIAKLATGAGARSEAIPGLIEAAQKYSENETDEARKAEWGNLANQLKDQHNFLNRQEYAQYAEQLQKLQEEGKTLQANRDNANRAANVSMAASSGNGDVIGTYKDAELQLKFNNAEQQRLSEAMAALDTQMESFNMTPEVQAAIERLKANGYTGKSGRKQHEADRQLVEKFYSGFGMNRKDFNTGDRARSTIAAGLETVGEGFSNLGAVMSRAVDYGMGVDGNVQGWENAGYATDELSAANLQRETNYEQNRSDYTNRWEKAGGNETFFRYAAEDLEKVADSLHDRSASDLAAAKADLGKMGQFMVDAGHTIITIGADMALAPATGGSSLVPMFLRTFGSSAAEARRSGASFGKQIGYGALNASVETITEKMFGAFDKLGYGKGFLPMGGIEKALRDSVKSDAGKYLMTVLYNSVEEGMEEVFSDLAAPFAKWIIDEQSRGHYFSEIEVSELFKDFLLGASLGGMGAVAGTGQTVGTIRGENMANLAAISQKQARGETLTPEEQMRLANGNSTGGLSMRQAGDLRRGGTREEAREKRVEAKQQKATDKANRKQEKADNLRRNFEEQAGIPQAPGAHEGPVQERRGAHEYQEKHGGDFAEKASESGKHESSPLEEETSYEGKHAVPAKAAGQHTNESARTRNKTEESREADYEPQAKHDGGQKYEKNKEGKPANDDIITNAFDSIAASKSKAGLREEDTSAGIKARKAELKAKTEAAERAVTEDEDAGLMSAKDAQGRKRKGYEQRVGSVLKKLGKGDVLSTADKFTKAEVNELVAQGKITQEQAKKLTMSDAEARANGREAGKKAESSRVAANKKAIEARRKLARGEELAPEDKLTRKEAETAFAAGLISEEEIKKFGRTKADTEAMKNAEPKAESVGKKPTVFKDKDERKNHADRAAELGYDEDTESAPEPKPAKKAPAKAEPKPVEEKKAQSAPPAQETKPVEQPQSKPEQTKAEEKKPSEKELEQLFTAGGITAEQYRNQMVQYGYRTQEWAKEAAIRRAKNEADKTSRKVPVKKASYEEHQKALYDAGNITAGEYYNRLVNHGLMTHDEAAKKIAEAKAREQQAPEVDQASLDDLLNDSPSAKWEKNKKNAEKNINRVVEKNINKNDAIVLFDRPGTRDKEFSKFWKEKYGIDVRVFDLGFFKKMKQATNKRPMYFVLDVKPGGDLYPNAKYDAGIRHEAWRYDGFDLVRLQIGEDGGVIGSPLIIHGNNEKNVGVQARYINGMSQAESYSKSSEYGKGFFDNAKAGSKTPSAPTESAPKVQETAKEESAPKATESAPRESASGKEKNNYANDVANIKEGESKRFDFSDGNFHSTYYVQNNGESGYTVYSWSDIGHSGEPLDNRLTADGVAKFLNDGGTDSTTLHLFYDHVPRKSGNTATQAEPQQSTVERIVNDAKRDYNTPDESGYAPSDIEGNGSESDFLTNSEEGHIYHALGRALENDEIGVKEYKDALRQYAPQVANMVLEEPPEAKLNNIKPGDTVRFDVYDPFVGRKATYYVRNNGENGYEVYNRSEPMTGNVTKDGVLEFLQDGDINYLYHNAPRVRRSELKGTTKQDAVKAATEAKNKLADRSYEDDGMFSAQANIDSAEAAYEAIERLYERSNLTQDDAVAAILEAVDLDALKVGVSSSDLPYLAQLALDKMYAAKATESKGVDEKAAKDATPKKPFVYTPANNSNVQYTFDGTTLKKTENGKTVRTITDRVAIDELLQSFFAEAGESPATNAPNAPETQPVVENTPVAPTTEKTVKPPVESPETPPVQQRRPMPQPSSKKKESKQSFRDKSQTPKTVKNSKVAAPFEFGKYDSASTEEVSRVADYRIEQNGYEAEIDRLNNQENWDRTDFAEAQRLIHQRTKQIYDQMTSDRGLVERGKYETEKSWQARCEARYQELRAPVDELLETYRQKKSDVAQKLQQNYKFNTADEIRMRAAYRFLNFTENGRVSYHGRSSANVRMYRVVNNILNKTEKAVADGNIDDVTKIVLDVSQIRGNENLFGETGRKGEIDGLEFLKASGATAEDIAAFAYGNINQMIDDFTPVKALDAVNQFRVMNMLSNIKTALNNILNNAAGMRVGAVSQNIGNLAAREFEKATGKKVAINDRSWKRSKEGIKAEQVAFVNAALMSYYGIQIENGRIELQNGANFRPTGNWFERLGARYSFFVNTFVMNPDQMGKARIDLGIQQGIDEAFEGVEMTPEMQANKKELEGYKEHEKSRRLVQADNATTALVQHFKDYLNKVKVGNDNIGYLRLGDFAMAFAKVPVNIVQQRIAATPYGALYHLLNSAKGFSQAKQMHQDVLEGKAGAKEMSAFDMARYSRDVGRAATTGGMLAIGALAAMTGALKDFGNDDDDDDETRIWREKGFNGLSLNISAMLRPFSSEWRDGDWVVGADFLEIFAAPLSIGALAWEAHKDGMSVSEAAWYATKRSFTDVLDAIADIPGMQAASQMYEAYTYSTGDGDDLSKTWSAVRQYLANSAASYVMPNLITQTATALDNNVRNPYAADNALQQSYQIFANKIPFLRNTLPVKTDMWGNARTYGDNRFEAFMNKVVLPGQIRKFKTNEYEKEIIRLSRAGYGGLLPNGTTPKKIEVGDNTYSLDSDQSLAFDAAYKDRYTEAYEAFMDSDLYKQLDDPQRQAALKMLRLDVTRQTKQEFLDATGAADDVTMDKWESLGSLEEKLQFVTAKQIASAAWDSEEGTVADYAMMDNFIQNQYDNLSQPVRDVLGNSLTHLDDMYNAYKEEQITSQQWQTCYDIYRQYNAKDEDGHALYKANIANSAQMWAEMQRESGLSDHQMSYIEDNMQMHTIISPNDDQYKEYLNDAGMTREETARTIKAMSELTFMDGYASVQNGQKYHVIAQTVPKEKQWAAFWSIVPGNASKANVAKMRKAQEDGLSFEDALKNNPMGYIYTKTTDSRGKTKKTRIS